MAQLIELPTFVDGRGTLTVLEKVLPFEIKRFFCVYDVKANRGGHRHHRTIQALICVGGQCEIYIDDGRQKSRVSLDSPKKCLILNPIDWHTMENFSHGATLLVFASEHFDPNDYIQELP